MASDTDRILAALGMIVHNTCPTERQGYGEDNVRELMEPEVKPADEATIRAAAAKLGLVPAADALWLPSPLTVECAHGHPVTLTAPVLLTDAIAAAVTEERGRCLAWMNQWSRFGQLQSDDVIEGIRSGAPRPAGGGK